ncbi:MAG: hypothetical protein JSS29_01905 [Proteobacteria bacterium]|nr:hypothetical protein [Pseudomonadota bacterium]
MPADAYISCRVTADVKSRLRELAVQEGLTESQLIKRLVSSGLPTTTVPPPPPAPHGAVRGTRTWRLCVRLPGADRKLLRERASGRGLSASTYAAHMIRVHLQGGNPLPKAEYLALRQAVLEMSAIGRNLNQVARVLQQEGRANVPGRAEVQTMLKIATGLKDHFRSLLAANERAWREW